MKVSSDATDKVRKVDSTTVNLKVGTVDSIWIYPVKGMSGIEVKSSRFNNLGLEHDRRWMLVDPRGRFMTQRELSEMTLFHPSIVKNKLVVSNAEGHEIRIPVAASERWGRRAVVWGSSCSVETYGKAVDEFFSDSLGRKCHLVKMSGDFKRRIAPYYSVNPGDSVSFADGFPFLITTTASLDDLSERVGEQVQMSRFRSNIIIRNEIPFEEDIWRILAIGQTRFHLVKPCARCVVTTIDQTTGKIVDGEPLRTLSKFRTTERSGKRKVLFGQNAIAEQEQGKVKVGDSVLLLKTRRRPSFR
jgi:uncharacterized protein YcbX